MKTIKIQTIEKKINRKLKTNSLIIGFDSSMHSTGISILKTTDKSLMILGVKLIEVDKGVKETDAIDLFTDQLDRFKVSLEGKYKFNKTWIENVYVGLNPKTGIYLIRIGTLIYDRFKNISNITEFIYPVSARALVRFKKSDKKVKGKQLKAELVDYVNKLFNIKVKNDDIADSLILSLAGLTKGN